jgi:anti-sigma regulatory factor (Ser/Thr protein kinase)
VNGGRPFRSSLELGALPGAVPCARLHTRQVTWEWGLTALADDAELIVSELVTNALEACPPKDAVAALRLSLSSDGSRLLIEVLDGSSHPPERTGAGRDGECGRGLLIVETISTQWGWRPLEGQRGKSVWALIEQPSNAPAADDAAQQPTGRWAR